MLSVKSFFLALVALSLFCYCKSRRNDDVLSFVNLRVTNVAKTTQKSARSRPAPCPPRRRCRVVPTKFVRNNKYLEALIQVSKGMAEARSITDLRKTPIVSRSRILALKSFMKIVLSASVSKRYSFARNVLGHALHCEEELGRNTIIPSLKKALGLDGFNELMSIDGDVTLVFTIDTTGSMGEEIRAAKEIVKSIASYPRRSSVDYVLSLFNDPGYGPVTKYSSRGQFEAAINNLQVHGGGDCKELTFHGIIDAINKGHPKPGSPMFVFTDAGTKDDVAGVLRGTEEYNLDNAIGLASEALMPVNFFYSTSAGSCKKPHTVQSFRDLAEITNGQQLLFDKGIGISNMGSITAAALDGLATIAAGGSKVSAMRRSHRARGKPNKVYNIPVDESMDKLIVAVTVTSGNVSPIKLQNHLGQPVRKTYLLAKGCVWVIENPHTGNWRLVVPINVGTHSFKITASSVSNIDFEYYFVQQLRPGSNAEVPIAHPLLGKTAKVKLLIPLKNKINTNTLELRLVGKDGSLLSTPVTLSGITATFNPPSVPFRFLLTGRTVVGNLFRRVSREIIQAKHILLRSIYTSTYFTIRRNPLRPVRTPAVFALHNTGMSEWFDIKVFSTLEGVTHSLSRSRIRVNRNRRSYFRVVFTVKPNVSLGQSTKVLITTKGRRSRIKTKLVTNFLVVRG